MNLGVVQFVAADRSSVAAQALARGSARSSPANTRSRIIARSNSLNTPSMPNSILPDCVEVSSACWCR
jgi:hypothetical protein